MEMANSNGLMDLGMKVSGNKAKQTVMESCTTQTVTSMKENGLMIKRTAMELTLMLTVLNM